MKENSALDTIESAIADIKAGKVIIVVDDENRENEGDFLAAAEAVTPDMINFMATHGRGLILCAPHGAPMRIPIPTPYGAKQYRSAGDCLYGFSGFKRAWSHYRNFCR